MREFFNYKWMFFLVLIVTGINANNSYSQSNNEGWKMLFNGKNLDGWKQLNGKAEYKVINNEIVGISTLKTPNSFLCSVEEYSDFILEFEVIVDPVVNSGVQFRSKSLAEYNNGRVHGYQFELDPSERAFSGGVFEEGKRGWLYPLSLNEKGRKAYKNGIWNTCRIEAIGNTIKTWINGVQCANLVDDDAASGFIALQVHSIGGNKSKDGKQIKWRNIKIKTNNLKKESWSQNPQVVEQSYLVNTITENEARLGWRLLWDGKTNKGWRGAKRIDFPKTGWEIKEGVLSVLATDGAESTGPGDIITEDLFSSFELELEFRITEGANSGIKYFVNPELNKGKGSAIGCEFQILDDKNHPDAKAGVNGNRTVGSLYDLITAEGLTIAGRKKVFKGVGNWNKARIVVKDGKVEHWLNNEKVIEYDRFSQMFKALVAYSKYKNWENFGQWPAGHILLQDHGNTVNFRSIKIREFN
ncbi:3-keto-disaccharide hydrolase [Algibacter lectus]|uniref:Uncharacterized protein DUF1080 n=1 Tax=Algibacter lectus TaxID=221126 RepID=A0A4R8MIW2_9FLAO|nr:DUF1080 domain-containing protein [Algibacter lectus]TDY64302.1 uncharacterized protein DUF1080 [Algibacter lectus]